MPIGIAEIPGIATVEGLLRRLYDLGARAPRCAHYLVDCFAVQDVVSNREGRRRCSMLRQTGVIGNIVLRPYRELQPTRQFEEGDRTMFELATDDAFRREAEAVSVEGQ